VATKDPVEELHRQASKHACLKSIPEEILTWAAVGIILEAHRLDKKRLTDKQVMTVLLRAAKKDQPAT
jgi:hypothetical protein